MRVTRLMCLWLVGLASFIQAATIEVSPGGDDANDGTTRAPVRTIGRALELAKAGDAVLIHSGTYREKMLRVGDGEKDKPIVIEAAPGAVVTIKGSTAVANWTKVRHGVWKHENWTVNSQQLFAGGKPLQQIGDKQTPWHTRPMDKTFCLAPVGKSVKDLVAGSFFYDAAQKTLYCRLADSGDPTQSEMEASVTPRLLDGYNRSYVTLRGLNFAHSNGTAEGEFADLVRVRGKGWLIERCNFTYGDFAGLSLAGEDHIVRHCRLTNNGNTGLGLNGSDEAHKYERYERPPQNILLENLDVTGNNYRKFYEFWHAGGMKLIPATRGVTVRQCRVADNWGPGIWFDSGWGDIAIEENIVERNRTGIFYEVCLPLPGDKLGATIRNNQVLDNVHQGIYVSASCAATVERNTCYGNEWGIVVHGMPREEFDRDLNLHNNVVRDNIIASKRGDLVLYTGVGAKDNRSDGNVYSSKRGPMIGVTSGEDYEPVIWQLPNLFAAHKIEEHGVAEVLPTRKGPDGIGPSSDAIEGKGATLPAKVGASAKPE